MTQLEQETYYALKRAAIDLSNYLDNERRNHAAMYAMMGMLASGNMVINPEELAKRCVSYADALIDELRK